MTLQARREKAAAAEATKAVAPQTKPTAPVKARRTKTVTGTMASIANMRAYQENDPKMADGLPISRFIFDPAGHNAKAIDDTVNKERVVNTSDMVAHLNETVFRKIFGVPLRGRVARQILDGIADQYLSLIEKGYFVKVPNLLSTKKVLRKARPGRNPKTGEDVSVPARYTIQVRAARALRDYLNATAE